MSLGLFFSRIYPCTLSPRIRGSIRTVNDYSNIILEVLTKCPEWSIDEIDSRRWKSVANNWLSSTDHCIPEYILVRRRIDYWNLQKIKQYQLLSQCVLSRRLFLFGIFGNILIEAVALPTCYMIFEDAHNSFPAKLW